LRLDLAQYAELAAFSQFASDLDSSTLKQLLRGQKLTEVIKQPQYQPLSVAKQVSILYAANEGYLDDVENDLIPKFKADWFDYFEANCSEIIPELNSGSNLTDEIKQKLDETLNAFKTTFTSK